MRNSLLLASRSAAALVPLALSVGACGGSDGAGIAISAVASAPVTDAQATAFQVTSSWLHLRHIELDLPAGLRCADVAGQLVGARCDEDDDDDDDEAKLKIAGPFVVDLLAGTSTPSFGGVVIPAGRYDRIDLRVDDGDPKQGVVAPGSPLDDNALALTATFIDRGQQLTLDLRLNFDEDIRIEQPGGVDVAPGEDLITRFAMADWLAGVDLIGCARSLTPQGGRVMIDDRRDGACSGIEDKIKDAMKRSGDLDDDDDDDE